MDTNPEKTTFDLFENVPALAFAFETATAKAADWPCRQIVASDSHLTKETETLLGLRLRAVTFSLLIGFGSFLVRRVVGAVPAAWIRIPVPMAIHKED